jgi:hypothetical protein
MTRDEERANLLQPEAAGRKYDTGKVSGWQLVPALEMIVRVLHYGAEKYTVRDESGAVVSDGAHNWNKVPEGRRRYLDALMRHAWAYVRGEENDPESGLPHLAHAGACILFLLSQLSGDPATKTP